MPSDATLLTDAPAIIPFATAAGFRAAQQLLIAYDQGVLKDQHAPSPSLRTAMRAISDEPGFAEVADVVKSLEYAAKHRLRQMHSPAEAPVGRPCLNETARAITRDLNNLVTTTACAANALVTQIDRPHMAQAPSVSTRLTSATQFLPEAARLCLARIVTMPLKEPDPDKQADVALRTVRTIAATQHAIGCT